MYCAVYGSIEQWWYIISIFSRCLCNYYNMSVTHANGDAYYYTNAKYHTNENAQYYTNAQSYTDNYTNPHYYTDIYSGNSSILVESR